jgi:AAA family ATP:ADP antiporter
MNTPANGNSLLDKILARFARVEPNEKRAVLIGFLLLFCVLGGYGAVRPVRETIGTVIGREATQDLWFFTALFGTLMVPLYGWLVAHVRRSVVLPAIYGFMAAAFIVSAFFFEKYPDDLMLARVFYVFISVMNLMLVSVFWSFLLEVFASEQTKRLFGVIAAGGTAGALVGPLTTSSIVAKVGNAGVLMVGAGMFIAALFLQRLLIKGPKVAAGAPAAAAAANDRGIGGNPFAGFGLVVRSPYLIGIMLFVIGISAINTFLYFEQLDLVEKQFKELTKRTQVFADLDSIVQGMVIVSQLFLTGRIATRFGVTLLLVTIPIVMVFGLTWYAFSGTFMMLAIAMVIRRWGEYAFIRPGREMLFSRVDKESKYKAKNLIDVAAYRIADATFAQVKKFLEASGIGGVKEALIAASVAALWALNGWWLGRRHEKQQP